MGFSFLGTGTDEIIVDKYATNVRGVLGYVFEEDTDGIAYALMGMIRAVDPGLSFSEAKDVGTQVLQAAKRDDTYSYNGIKYMFSESGDTVILGFVIEE